MGLPLSPESVAMHAKFKAALEARPKDARLLCMAANFEVDVVGDVEAAQALFERALVQTPEDSDVLFSLATTMISTGSGLSAHQDRAIELYRRCLKFQPTHTSAAINLGVMLIQAAQVAKAAGQAAAAGPLIDEARTLMTAADGREPGSCAYNLACAEVSAGNVDAAKKWLLSAATHGTLPPSTDMKEDTDLDPLRAEPWFIELVASVTKKEKARRTEPIPVTLLSGFLGAGKTTLLKRILRDRGHGMKIAVVVNDMGAMNFDADEIKRHKLVQEKGTMVEFHNGCICCTLRGDLLKTVKELSEEVDEEGSPAFEYIVIESTGISEPLPVAQTFVMDVNSCDPQHRHGHGHGHEHEHEGSAAATFEPLSKYARMDTLVTVVDLYNVLHILGTPGGDDVNTTSERERLLGEDHKDPYSSPRENTGSKEEGSKGKQPSSLYQLLVDQLEFANVILLNKVDLVHPEDPELRHRHVMLVRSLVRKFNTDAKIFVPGYEFEFGDAVSDTGKPKPTGGVLTKNKFADFDVSYVIDTKLFDMRKAQMSAGWLQELQKDLHGGGHTPETEEYGIGSFVWRTPYEDPRPFHPMRLKRIMRGFGRMPELMMEKAKGSDDDADTTGPFVGVVRSKGQLWLAFGHAIPIDFHTAGRHVNMQGRMPFLDALPRHMWSPEAHAQYEKRVREKKWHVAATEDEVSFGDRGSGLVIIGVDMTPERKQAIIEALNSALLTGAEMAAGIKAFKKGDDGKHPWQCLEDPFFGGTGPETMWELEFRNPQAAAGGRQ